MNNRSSRILCFFFSVFLSVLFIWLTGFFFCDSLRPYTYDPDLDKFIYIPNQLYRQRSEGFAKTWHGLYGINGIRNIKNDKRSKIIIWGDSYIEAHQVNDSEKIPQRITAKLSAAGLHDKLMSYGVGMSGDSVADYYFDIPRYENLTRDVYAHYIIITSFEDTLPDQPTDTSGGVFKSEPLRFQENGWAPRIPKIKEICNRFGVFFVWTPFLAVRSALTEFSLLPKWVRNGHQSDILPQPVEPSDMLRKYWSFLFQEIQKQTEKPVNFVYCPVIPAMNGGKIIRDDRDDAKFLLFKEIAEGYGVTVLDAREPFISFYDQSGLFPRGFINSRPSGGHLNKYGHDIVAGLITSHILTKEVD